MQIGQREFFQDACQRDGMRHTSFSFFVLKFEELAELREVDFGPALDFGEGGEIGEESEQDDDECGGKGVGRAVFGAWIVHFFERSDEDVEGGGCGHIDLHA